MTTPFVPSDTTSLESLKLLTDEVRWQLLHALRYSDRQVRELVEWLKLPQNLVSYHLGILRQAGLVHTHRSEADARVQYYSLDLPSLQHYYEQIGTSLHLLAVSDKVATIDSLSVVFICSANSARSQMAEGLLRQLSGGVIKVRSAGIKPSTIHPTAIQVMTEIGIDIEYQQAKSIIDLQDYQPDVVITVCDKAREICEPCFDAPLQLHWSIPNPTYEIADTQYFAFQQTRDMLVERIQGLLALLPVLTSTKQ
ncbi:MAG: ArsR family transcriptional regulator [Chloroflexota bacterium]